jgi:hypothetical protein
VRAKTEALTTPCARIRMAALSPTDCLARRSPAGMERRRTVARTTSAPAGTEATLDRRASSTRRVRRHRAASAARRSIAATRGARTARLTLGGRRRVRITNRAQSSASAGGAAPVRAAAASSDVTSRASRFARRVRRRGAMSSIARTRTSGVPGTDTKTEAASSTLRLLGVATGVVTLRTPTESALRRPHTVP